MTIARALKPVLSPQQTLKECQCYFKVKAIWIILMLAYTHTHTYTCKSELSSPNVNHWAVQIYCLFLLLIHKSKQNSIHVWL